MTADSADTERSVVKTYVPRYQKQRWLDSAEELDMSQSEFVRTMVQAGRRGFEFESGGADPPEDEPRSPDPGGDGLETRLLDVLSTDTYLTWDELVDEVVGEFEDELESALQSLTAEERIVHSPRQSGYALPEATDE